MRIAAKYVTRTARARPRTPVLAGEMCKIVFERRAHTLRWRLLATFEEESCGTMLVKCVRKCGRSL